MDIELADDVEKRRKVAGYIWRETVENLQQICMSWLVEEDDLAKRKRLGRMHELLEKLSKAQGGE
jgi:hypothetical protein